MSHTPPASNREYHRQIADSLADSFLRRTLDKFAVEYRAGAAPRDFLAHETEEFFVLISGRVRFYVYGDATFQELGPGGTVYLKANIPHRVELVPGVPGAKALIVYSEVEGSVNG